MVVSCASACMDRTPGSLVQFRRATPWPTGCAPHIANRCAYSTGRRAGFTSRWPDLPPQDGNAPRSASCCTANPVPGPQRPISAPSSCVNAKATSSNARSRNPAAAFPAFRLSRDHRMPKPESGTRDNKGVWAHSKAGSVRLDWNDRGNQEDGVFHDDAAEH